MEPIIIIGTGLAGYNLAREFRKLDSTTPLLFVTSDDGSFYSKPMLSNALAKQKQPAELANFDADKMAGDLNAEIMTFTRVEGIDPKSHCISTSQGDTLNYSKLVLAVGARPVEPLLVGDGVELIYTVNSLQDYAGFRESIDQIKHIAIIGAGLIGCEFANDLLSAGYRVSVIGPDRVPLGRLLPPEAGDYLKQRLAEAGVNWLLGESCTVVNKQNNEFVLELNDGKTLRADMVLSAIGLKPDTTLAEAAGLKTGRGIAVDRKLQTSDPDIYALGDCAELEGRVLAYVMPLMQGARALAKTLAGEPTEVTYPAMPIIVKTPACPCTAAPPPAGTEGEWRIEQTGKGLKAIYIGKTGELLGFALLGEAVNEKLTLTRQLPAVMP